MTTNVESAERVLADLQAKRDQSVADGHKLGEERARIAFQAHTGDKGARRRLDEVNLEIARLESDRSGLDSAIAEANSRVQQAQAAEASAADRQRAKQAQTVAAQIGARLKRAHASLSNGFDELAAAERELSELHALGVTHPNHAAFRVNAVLALKTLLRRLPAGWRRDFADRIELGHSERLTLLTFWNAVQTSIDRQTASRIGNEAKAKEPAA
jgi:hypothetical protein